MSGFTDRNNNLPPGCSDNNIEDAQGTEFDDNGTRRDPDDDREQYDEDTGIGIYGGEDEPDDDTQPTDDREQHTPGPWHTRHNPKDRGHYFVLDSDEFLVVECDGSQGVMLAANGIDAANARLIASAPDLLKACEQARWALRNVEAWEIEQYGAADYHRVTRPIEELDIVINKAKGA
jgi:hypothetical protein